MVAELEASLARLVRQAYWPYAALSDLLRAFLDVAVAFSGSKEGLLCLDEAPGAVSAEEGVLTVTSNPSDSFAAVRFPGSVRC